MARAISISVSVSIGDREYEASGRYYPGSSAYFDAGFGNYLPGDPSEVTDIELRDEDNQIVDLDSLDRAALAYVEERLADAADTAVADHLADLGDRAYDESRDACDRRDW